MGSPAPRRVEVMRGIDVIVAPLDVEPESIEQGAASLSAAERERAARFRFDADRRRFVAAHSMLRALLAEREGRGRWCFSLSRSGELAAYAFARGGAVGIDVEAIQPLAQADAVAARIFPRREWREYAALAASEKAAGFFRGWTRTEALAKALGGGLTLSPDVLEAALEGRWVVRDFVPAPGFAGALACSRRGSCP